MSSLRRSAELLPLVVHATTVTVRTQPGALPDVATVDALRRHALRLGGLPAMAAGLLGCYGGAVADDAASGDRQTCQLDLHMIQEIARILGLDRRPLHQIAVRLATQLSADIDVVAPKPRFDPGRLVTGPTNTAAILLELLSNQHLVNGRLVSDELSARGLPAVQWRWSRVLPAAGRRVLDGMCADLAMDEDWPVTVAAATTHLAVPADRTDAMMRKLGPHIRPALRALAARRNTERVKDKADVPVAGDLLGVTALLSDLFVITRLIETPED